MMKTTFEVTDTVYRDLIEAGFETEITGEIYKDLRPVNSTNEDVVINCLPMSNDQVQMATANVNIYVPDLESKANKTPQYFPNHKRLSELASKASSILEYVVSDEYEYFITLQSIQNEEAIHQHFVNLRIEYRFYNLPNT